jgi:hypothetical protein
MAEKESIYLPRLEPCLRGDRYLLYAIGMACWSLTLLITVTGPGMTHTPHYVIKYFKSDANDKLAMESRPGGAVRP